MIYAKRISFIKAPANGAGGPGAAVMLKRRLRGGWLGGAGRGGLLKGRVSSRLVLQQQRHNQLPSAGGPLAPDALEMVHVSVIWYEDLISHIKFLERKL
jgi:hypothetical protein